MNMEQNRESSYDLLRVVSAVAIIAIHVSGTYQNAVTNITLFGFQYTSHIFTTVLYNTLSRFAVPCFVMLSGAFILSDERNTDYRFFYKKTFRKIGIPTLLFSIFYIVFSIAKSIAAVAMGKKEWTAVFLPIIEAIQGRPFYHMWYLYMIIGVYLLVPIVHRYKNDRGGGRKV